jgi:CspA family cold shock protein
MHVMSNHKVGIVKWFSAGKGYGFIALDNGDDVFLYYSDIQRGGFPILAEGQRVEFDVTPGVKTRNAVNVRPL